MALEEHSFRHLLPTFIISPGTQVVLKVDKPLPEGTVRQRGSVAVIFQQAYRGTSLPEQPDYRRVDEFLIWARRRPVDA